MNTSSGAVFGLGPYLSVHCCQIGSFRIYPCHCARWPEYEYQGQRHHARGVLPADGRKPCCGFCAGKIAGEIIAPFVGALASRDVPCTGETFSVGGGRAARVVLATVPGLLDATSIDTVLTRFDEALGSNDFYVPKSGFDEIVYGCTHLGLDPTTVMSPQI